MPDYVTMLSDHGDPCLRFRQSNGRIYLDDRPCSNNWNYGTLEIVRMEIVLHFSSTPFLGGSRRDADKTCERDFSRKKTSSKPSCVPCTPTFACSTSSTCSECTRAPAAPLIRRNPELQQPDQLKRPRELPLEVSQNTENSKR